MSTYEGGGNVMGIYEVLLDPPPFAAVFAPVRGSNSTDSLLAKYAGSLYTPASKCANDWRELLDVFDRCL
jgi:hypothetical protein